MAFIINIFSRTQKCIYFLWYRCKKTLLEHDMMHFSRKRLIKPDECNDAANAEYATSATARARMLFSVYRLISIKRE